MKRIIAILLAIMIISSTGIVSINVDAADNKAGNNITWDFDVYNCVLTLTGNGNMTDFGPYNAPWYGYAKYIKKVNIGSGITSIGSWSFNNCIELEEVNFPNTLATIGKDSFVGCKKISSITIPDSVKTIGFSAFSYCNSLASVSLPNNLSYIDDFVFSHCENLIDINIPDNVTSIGSFAFGSCSKLSLDLPLSLQTIKEWAFDSGIKSFRINETNAHFATYDGVLYSKDKEKLLFYPCMMEDKSFTIPSGVKQIAKEAFYHNKYLETIVLSKGIEEIEESAFISMEALKEVVISKDVKTIGEKAFSNCQALETVSIEDGVKEIKDNAFLSCVSLKRISVPKSITTIGEKAIGYEDRYISEYNKHEYPIVEGTTIICEKDSVAENYAKTNGINYENPKYITIYIENTMGWDSIYFYHWKMNGTSQEDAEWPGIKLMKEDISDSGNDLYSVKIPEDSSCINYLIFNDGNGKRTYDKIIPGGYDTLFFSATQTDQNPNRYFGGFYAVVNDEFIALTGPQMNRPHEFVYEDEENDDYSVKAVTIKMSHDSGIMGYCFGTNSTLSGDNKFNNNPYYPIEGFPKEYSVTIPITSEGDYYYCVIGRNGIDSNGANGSFRIRKVAFFNNGIDSQPYTTKLYPTDTEVKLFIWGSTEKQYISGYSVLPTLAEPEYVAGNSYKFTGNVNLYALWKDKLTQAISIPQTNYYKKCGDSAFNLNASINSGAKLYYSSSNDNVARVSSEGQVLLVSEGVCTITISAKGTYEGDPQYMPDSKDIKINVTKKNQTIKVSKTKYTKTYGAKAFNLLAKSSSGIGLIYKSSNTKIVTVSSKGKVTIKGYGSATIKIATKDSNIYNNANKSVIISVIPKQVDRQIKRPHRDSSNHSITLEWKKDKTVSGYQAQVSKNKNYKSVHNLKVIKKHKTTAKNLKVGTIYHFRIRAYKKVEGKKIYGKWLEIHKIPAI